MAGEGFREGQRCVSPVEGARTDLDLRATRVVCPRCGRATDSLKVYDESVASRLPKVVASCPACMRRSVWRRALLVFPWSFVFMPLFAWFLISDYRESRRAGHSDPAVAEAYRMSRGEHFEDTLGRVNLRKIPRREWFLFGLVLALIAAFWATALACLR